MNSSRTPLLWVALPAALACSEPNTQIGPALSGQWTPLPAPAGTLVARNHPSAVYTGDEVILWGGGGPCTPPADAITCDNGLRFDLNSEQWTQMSGGEGAPAPRWLHTGLWTGERMAVFGGACVSYAPCSDGGLFDPVTNLWEVVKLPDWHEPTTRPFVGLVGQSIVVWGGFQQVQGSAEPRTVFRHGSLLDLNTLTWAALTAEVESPSADATLIVIGDKLLAFDEAAVFTLDGNRWVATDAQPRPKECCASVMATADGVLASGKGILGAFVELDKFEWWIFEVSTGNWTSLGVPAVIPPPGLDGFVWTGSLALLWGGSGGNEAWGCVGHYLACNHVTAFEPVTRQWFRVTAEDAPSPRSRPAALWTHKGLFIWGGSAPTTALISFIDGALLQLDQPR